MPVTKEYVSPTELKLKIAAAQPGLEEIKQRALKALASDVKIAGFRAGKAPLNLIEKQIDPSRLQSEFLDQAVNRLYADVVNAERLRPVVPPKVSVTKFVPFSTLELDISVEVVGEIKLGNYKSVKLARPPVSVTAKDVSEVIQQLKTRAAEREEVSTPAKDGDEVVIDFSGRDAATKAPISGADGKDYPLILGSGTFIPGFEPNLVGLKAGEHKDFTLEFPKDYGVAALQSRRVDFSVSVKKVQKIVDPELDDAFAAKVGPFKTLAELKADVKKQLTAERKAEAERQFENDLIDKIAADSSVAIPDALIDDEVAQMERQEKQNLAYRGQTWQEHLAAEDVDEAAHRQRQRPQAEQRVKTGLVLAEIAEQEKITVTPEELEVRLQLLKGQYQQDKLMQAELNKPEARREIASRLITEKTIDKLKTFASK